MSNGGISASISAGGEINQQSVTKLNQTTAQVVQVYTNNSTTVYQTLGDLFLLLAGLVVILSLLFSRTTTLS